MSAPSAGEQYGQNWPAYRLPPQVLFDLAAAALRGQRRSFRAHALALTRGIRPPPLVRGEENIPRGGPGVLVTNHYWRPGFWMPWLPAAASAAAPCEVTWVMTSALTFPGWPLRGVLRVLSQQVLPRVTGVYGFLTMPPMPPDPREVLERAAAVRRLVGYVRANPTALLGLAPEGGDQPGGVLTLPPPGVGRLAMRLADLGLPFYPLGVYEEGRRLVLQFGREFTMLTGGAETRAEHDRLAAAALMAAIAECLPARLRGEFR